MLGNYKHSLDRSTVAYQCSGYLRKDTAVVSVALLFVYLGLSKEFASKKRKKFLDGQ